MTPIRRQKQGGFALFIGLVLLAVLTMVAVLGVRSSGIEVQMAANSVARIEAFDVSETTRRPLGEIVDVHTFARGWPQYAGGTVPDSDFAYQLPQGFSLCGAASEGRECNTALNPGGNPPRDWYIGNSEVDPAFNPVVLDTDAVLERVDNQPIPLRARYSVFKLLTDLNPGAGSAMVAGYEGIGKSAAGGGGRVFYYLSSVGREPRAANAQIEAEAETGANFRHVVRN